MIIRVLSVLLAVQLALTVILYWPRDVERGVAEALVPALTADGVDRVTIDDGESSVVLSRDGERWLLDNALPADRAKLGQLLAVLTESDPGYAIARSDSAARRFEVADADYQRRVTLRGDGGEAVAYLGSSPAFRKIHARAEGSDAIHVLDFNSFDAPTSAASWLDRSLLALPDVEAIDSGALSLRRDEGQWSAVDGASVDAEAAEKLVQGLSSLRVTGLANDEDRSLAAEGDEVASLVARNASGEFTITVIESGDSYFLRSSAYDVLFPTSAYDAERIVDALGELRGAKEDTEAEAGSDEDGEVTGDATES